jgi:cobalamin biosynthesis Co2+ chelatase CbiK
MENKMTEIDAMYIKMLNNAGFDAGYIATLKNYKKMDVINVVRGNSFSSVTGILHCLITTDEVITVAMLLRQEHPYRDIASYSGIDANKVRNIKGYLQYNKVR